MCFSASASLIAAAALTATGVATTSKVEKREELPFAIIPLFFGIQQLFDGIVWLSTGGTLVNSIAAYGYAFLAYAFWPILLPFAVLKIEKNERRKKILRLFLAIGAITSLYGIYLMLNGPLVARSINSCIRYDTALPYWEPMIVLYLLATCGSCFVSSERFIRLFGLVVFISSLIAGWFYLAVFSSVWCFFAAVLSSLIYWRFRRNQSK
jgi:hypothetical protein